ncbi:hypothetical protein [Pontiella sulfatireligans]|uniref:hypothetical protein n=1 Tax=Pontiella sulfatireligans TaxID=2750658 RepID=UPI00109D3C4D|nr:hypothetical protein [Pontiella sulfatireligans]
MKKWLRDIKPSEWPIFMSVLVLGILISVGSVKNDYSAVGSYMTGALRMILELILIYTSLIRKSTTALILLLGLWLSSVLLGVYFFFSSRADSIVKQYGLGLMSIVYFGLCLWIVLLYKNRKRLNQPSEVVRKPIN